MFMPSSRFKCDFIGMQQPVKIVFFRRNKMRKIISNNLMSVSKWSGGTTTEIFIYPQHSVYAERNFIFRVSTALVELESSDFTLLPDYNRLIASLQGEMRLSNGKNEVSVKPFANVYHFDGGDNTHCEGKARDLNLMLKKGSATGELFFAEAGESFDFNLSKDDFVLLFYHESGYAVVLNDGEFKECLSDNAAIFKVKLVGDSRYD